MTGEPVPGHVIHMSLDHSKPLSESVAACDCGWEFRVPWSGKAERDRQDAAIYAHWDAVRAV